jgi:hypothetical protein
MPVRLRSHAAASTVSARRALSLALLAVTALVLLIAAAPASALVTEVGANTVGLQPRNSETVGTLGSTPETFDNFEGNPVMHSNSTFAIYWDPTNHYHGDWQHVIDNFLSDIGSASSSLASVFAVDEQYTDRTNQPANYRSTFKGAFTDTTKYPTSGCTDPNPFEEEDQIVLGGVHTPICLTAAQLREELQKFIAQHSLPKGMSTIFYLLTPPGVAVCLDAGTSTGHCSSYSGAVGASSYEQSFCSYHSAVNPGGLATGDANTILYAAIPWTAGGLGNYHLRPEDRRPGFDCQDGGFDPSTHPPEKKEAAKSKSPTEIKEFEEKNAEQKEAQEAAEQREGPHTQEPNQVPCPSSDGGCDTGLADLIVNQIAVEQQNTVTNPLLNAWQDSGRHEATDECRNAFAPILGGSSTAVEGSEAGSLYNQELEKGTYYLNDAFSRAAYTLDYPGVPCLTGAALEPLFTAPSQVNAGELVGFNGMESDIALNAAIHFPPVGERQTTYPTFTWNFGDGTPTVTGFAPGGPSVNSPGISPCEAPWLAPCAASTYHSYQYGGTYEVTLTVKDVGNNVANVTRTVGVTGPPPPGPPAPPSPGTDTGASPSGAAAGSSGAGSGGGVGAHATPVATQAIVSRNLATVLRGGLVVRYSVNEQVAGRFEVLLASSIARRLGLHGARATGLAKGLTPQTVIAKAVLVTTKGGRSTFKILFSKATAARLRRLKSVSLMIRLSVHNSASGTTTVLNTVKLTH